MLETAGSNGQPAPIVGLVLPGGGARSAYQAGVLDAIASLCGPHDPAPFPVVVGTSAGSINAAYLASCLPEFASASQRLCELWGNLSVNEVYRAGFGKVAGVLLQWLWALVTGGLRDGNPRALLDNSPLRELLRENSDLTRIQRNIDSGALRGLAITTAGYGSERSLTWFQAHRDVQPWWRERREGRPGAITLDHVMASLALPIIFPPVRIAGEWCGDGSTRQFAPLSPAIHLGAEKILIVDTQYPAPIRSAYNEQGESRHPSMSRITGYLLDTIFSDSLYADLERLEQINRLLEADSGESKAGKSALRSLETLLITPSRRIVSLAARHRKALPKAMRWLLHSSGDSDEGGDLLLSYMLFQAGYCSELIELGRRDALARADELRRFLGISRTRVAP